MDTHRHRPEEVLGLPSGEIPPYISRKIADKELSTLVRDLNAQLLEGGDDARRMAAEALAKLGFTTD